MAEYGVAEYGASTYGALENAINSSEILSEIAKTSIKEFLKDTFNELWTTLEDLVLLNPPEDLQGYWDILLEIIQKLF